MPTVRSLRWQHDQASRMMLQLINRIKAHQPEDDAYPIALQLAAWVSLLRTHLATEDEWFYPAMMALEDEAAVAAAVRFRREMGHLGEALEEFDRNWSSSAVIGARFARFRTEAFTLFSAVERRIAHEDHILYPLALNKGVGAMPTAA